MFRLKDKGKFKKFEDEKDPSLLRSSSPSKELKINICVLGKSQSGKSALVHKFVNGKFDPNLTPVLNGKFDPNLTPVLNAVTKELRIQTDKDKGKIAFTFVITEKEFTPIQSDSNIAFFTTQDSEAIKTAQCILYTIDLRHSQDLTELKQLKTKLNKIPDKRIVFVGTMADEENTTLGKHEKSKLYQLLDYKVSAKDDIENTKHKIITIAQLFREIDIRFHENVELDKGLTSHFG